MTENHARLRAFKHYHDKGSAVASDELRDAMDLLRDYDALAARLAEAERDAALGRIAMRFVDRAGDTCDEDPAETICVEFYLAMAEEVERQRATRGLPAASLPPAVTRKVVPPGWRDVLDHARQTLGAGGGVGQAGAANAELERKIGEPLIDFIEEELAAADSAEDAPEKCLDCGKTIDTCGCAL